jgi:hypothetical protein
VYRLKKLLVASIALLLVLLSAAPAIAQQNKPGSGLSISPTLSEFTLKPGQADTLDITLKNITSNDVTAQASIYDFESDNNTGSPKILGESKEDNPHSIGKFITGLEDVPLKVGEQKKVTLPVQAPSDVVPGAYYGIIRYKAVPAGENAPAPGEVSLSASVGTIVLISVPGNVKEQVQLTGLHVYKGDSDGTLFFDKPDKVGVEIKNLGNGFVKPFGTVEVQSMTGKKIYSYQLNNTNPRATILPDSSRIFTDALKNISGPGRYTVTASVSYGTGSQVLTLKKTFWYIPLWLAGIILAVLILLVLLAYMAYRRYRHDRKRAYKRRG